MAYNRYKIKSPIKSFSQLEIPKSQKNKLVDKNKKEKNKMINKEIIEKKEY